MLILGKTTFMSHRNDRDFANASPIQLPLQRGYYTTDQEVQTIDVRSGSHKKVGKIANDTSSLCSAIRKKRRTKAMSLLRVETQSALQRQGLYRSWCDICQSCHDSRNKPYRHDWFYMHKEYSSADLDEIKWRVRAQRTTEPCLCGECWQEYEYDSEFEYYLDI